MGKVRSVSLGFFGITTLLVMWQVMAVLNARSSPETARFVPGLGAIYASAVDMLTKVSFWEDLAYTNARVLGGFISAVILALPITLLLVHSRVLDLCLGPVFDFVRYIPVPALVPLSIIWVGIGETQKVTVLFIGTFFQLLVMATDAARRVPSYHLESALTLGLSRSDLVLSVTLPAAGPQIYDACRVCVGLTWSYVLVAELVASERGIGYGIIRAQRFLQTDQIIVSMIVLGLVGLAYDRLFVVARPIWFPWDEGK